SVQSSVSSARRCRSVFFRIIRRPQMSTPFPYTTLFRSNVAAHQSKAIHALAEMEPQYLHLLPRPRALHADRIRHGARGGGGGDRSEEHTSELQSRRDIVCRLLLEKKKSAMLLRCTCTCK